MGLRVLQLNLVGLKTFQVCVCVCVCFLKCAFSPPHRCKETVHRTRRATPSEELLGHPFNCSLHWSTDWQHDAGLHTSRTLNSSRAAMPTRAQTATSHTMPSFNNSYSCCVTGGITAMSKPWCPLPCAAVCLVDPEPSDMAAALTP